MMKTKKTSDIPGHPLLLKGDHKVTPSASFESRIHGLTEAHRKCFANLHRMAKFYLLVNMPKRISLKKNLKFYNKISYLLYHFHDFRNHIMKVNTLPNKIMPRPNRNIINIIK